VRQCLQAVNSGDNEKANRIARITASLGYVRDEFMNCLGIERAVQGERQRAMKDLAVKCMVNQNEAALIEDELRPALGYTDDEYLTCRLEAIEEAAQTELTEMPFLGFDFWIEDRTI
jgi:hypothetical protein